MNSELNCEQLVVEKLVSKAKSDHHVYVVLYTAITAGIIDNKKAVEIGSRTAGIDYNNCNN